MRPPRACAVVAAMLLSVAVTSGKEVRVPPPGVRESEVVLPGPLVGYALPPNGSGGHDLLALVGAREDGEPEDEPKDEPSAAQAARQLPPCPVEPRDKAPLTLLRVDFEGDGQAVPRAVLPADSRILDRFDVGGAPHWIVVRDTGIYGLPAAGDPAEDAPLVTLLEREEFFVLSFDPRLSGRPFPAAVPWVFSVALGELTWYGPDDDGAAFAALGSASLPLAGWASRDRLGVASPPPALIGQAHDGALLLATPPRAFGKQRLKTVLFEIDTAREPRVIECWSRLPTPEDTLERHFLMLDGRPMLLVATKSANELGLFTEKRLRLYRLERDRSRLGLAPIFAAESGMNLWQEGRPLLRDANGDGRADLILVYWKGLKDDRVVLEVYRGLPDGGFETQAVTTALDVEDGDRSFALFDADLDGDDLTDLLVRGGGHLLLYRGMPSKSGKALVGTTPETLSVWGGESEPMIFGVSTGGIWDATPRSSAAGPRLVDLDGNGLAEILVVEPGGADAPGRFRLLRRETPSGTAQAPRR